MRGLAAAFLLLSILSPAMAQQGPICREYSVVDEIARAVKAQDYYSRISPGLITEQPTPDPNIVRCQVCVLSAPYDMLRFNERPAGRCLFRSFEVQVVPRGFVVAGPR